MLSEKFCQDVVDMLFPRAYLAVSVNSMPEDRWVVKVERMGFKILSFQQMQRCGPAKAQFLVTPSVEAFGCACQSPGLAELNTLKLKNVDTNGIISMCLRVSPLLV